MSYHSPMGFRNAREFGCGCRAWFEPGCRLCWIDDCFPECETPERIEELGEQRGFVVAMLDDRLFRSLRAWPQARP